MGWVISRYLFYISLVVLVPHHSAFQPKSQVEIGVLKALAVVAEEREETLNLRRAHFRELLGGRFEKSRISRTAATVNADVLMKAHLKARLPKVWKKSASKIASTISAESRRYGFDPLFVLAVIESESEFDPVRLGSFGEIGLMQILPSTAKWLCKKQGLKWRGARTLNDPETNIKIGTAYLAMLRKRFDSHGQLYLAAYNMGVSNVNHALNRQIWPKDYPKKVMTRYLSLYKNRAQLEKRSNLATN